LLPSQRSHQVLGITPDFLKAQIPNPRPEDFFFRGEKDRYEFPIPAFNGPWRQPRPEEIARLGQCASQNPTAVAKYQAAPSAATPSDYQVLFAEDVLACAQKLGVGIRPLPEAPADSD
jgi:hypothetical protein